MDVTDISGSEHADLTFLHSILPQSYEYTVTEFIQGEKENAFNCTIRLAIFEKEEALKWLKEFEDNSLTTWKVDRTHKECTPRIIFKKEYHCHHNTKPKNDATPHEKHTNCPSKLTITIKQFMKRSEDKYIKTHPCQVYMRFIHNHDQGTSASLRHRVPSEAVRRIFEDLFKKNHSPSSALQTYKFDLKSKYGYEYFKVSANGSVCPTQKWVYDLYYKIFKKEYGDPDGEGMITAMENFIEEYNAECGERCAASKRSEIGFCVAFCSPLMKRVHIMLETSKDVNFIDSSGNMDRHNSRVFLIMCESPIGALPLGIFITYSESEENILQGLELLIKLFPESSFYGQKYASVVLTDDCTALRNSVRRLFPTSNLFLCIFHVLQNVMRYLWLGKNNVKPEDRKKLYRLFQKCLYSKDVEEFQENIVILNQNCFQYKQVQNYFEKLQKRADEWALCYRGNLTRGNNTNNYCEATFRILKDKIFQRLKSFNILQLFHFLTSKFDDYYIMKITDVINGRGKKSKKYNFSEAKLNGLEAVCIGESLYEVQNNVSKRIYSVDTATSFCTCYVGSSGAPCKHQFLVSKNFRVPLQFLTSFDTAAKLKYHKIAYGDTTDLPPDWYNNLVPDEPCINIVASAVASSSESVENCSVETDLHKKQSEEFDSQKCAEELKLVFEDLNQKLHKNPSVYGEPIKKFIEGYNKCKTESAIVSALHTFGKYNNMPLIKKGKNLQGGKVIGVQPTAVQRRKIKVGGRAVSKCGRPPKISYTAEHAYGKRKIEKTNFPQVQVKMSKPHSLSFCTTDVKNNGES